jgi:hypothetical protein
MRRLLFHLAVTGVLLFAFSLTANAQINKVPVKALSLTKDVTFFVVGQSAKLAGAAAKASGKAALKASGQTSLFMLKQTKNVMLKAMIPAGRQLIVKYLKYRLMP